MVIYLFFSGYADTGVLIPKSAFQAGETESRTMKGYSSLTGQTWGKKTLLKQGKTNY